MEIQQIWTEQGREHVRFNNSRSAFRVERGSPFPSLPGIIDISHQRCQFCMLSNAVMKQRSNLNVRFQELRRRKSLSSKLDLHASKMAILSSTESSRQLTEQRQEEKTNTRMRPIIKKKGNYILETVDDQMNHEHLKKLEKIFENTKTEGTDGLTMEQFRIAMKKTMGEEINDKELDLMFMKVDNDCDGTVDWNEYLSYMLLEYQERQNMISRERDIPFVHPMEEKRSNHIAAIRRIALLQAMSTRKSKMNSADIEEASRYLTLSEEGVLNVWNIEWTLQKTINLRGGCKSVWYTDMACLANCNSFAISGSDYVISFYSFSSNFVQKKFQIRDLRCCALTMDYSCNQANPQKGVLLWGDTGGNLFIIRFYENPSVALFSNSNFPDGKCQIRKLMMTQSKLFQVFKLEKVHDGWVQQARYFTTNKGQESVLSCCSCNSTALLFSDITEMKDSKKTFNKRSYFRVSKGILCVTYDTEWSLIITGGRDSIVRVWNPFIVHKSLAVLKGHNAAVTEVLVRSGDRQAVSISKDSNIRVWELRYYTCKQNINGRYVYLGRQIITSAFFNENKGELMLGSNRIGVFYSQSKASTPIFDRFLSSHDKAVSCVLYNNLFHLIVTGAEDSMVCIWDVETGRKKMQFCAEEGVEIVTMSFDPTWRRLATGMRNGFTLIWNFNNGACLRRIASKDSLEISTVLFCENKIITAGWGRSPMVYVDSKTDESSFSLRQKHDDDIMTLDFHKDDCLLASAAYDGDIFIWSLEKEMVVVAFNMYKSLLPVHVGTPAKPWLTSTGQLELNLSEAWLPSTMPWLAEDQSLQNISMGAKVEFQTANTVFENPMANKEMAISYRAVYKVLFLQTRDTTEISAALLASCAKGWITAWSVHAHGGLLGYFVGTQDSQLVTAMATDSKDNILITGDSKGRMKIWKIEGYCDVDDVTRHRNSQQSKEETLSDLSSLPVAFVPTRHFLPKSIAPELRCSFRGHTRAITSIAFIEGYGLMASGCVDCSVRLWTLDGRYIGTFGQSRLWNIGSAHELSSHPPSMPEDIRRVASANTFLTVKGGYNGRWRNAKNVVTFFTKPARNLMRQSTATERANAMKSRLAEVDIAKESDAGRVSRRENVSIFLQDIPNPVRGAMMSSNKQVEENFIKKLKCGITSSILGNFNYKPKKRHREFRLQKGIRWSNDHVSVYNSLHFVNLDNVTQPEVPEMIKEKLSCLSQQRSQDDYEWTSGTSKVRSWRGLKNVKTLLAKSRSAMKNQSSGRMLPTVKISRHISTPKSKKFEPFTLPSIAL